VIKYPNLIQDRYTLVKMREIIDEVNRVSPLVASHAEQLQTPIPNFAEIQQALSAGGTNPLNTKNLPGTPGTPSGGPAVNPNAAILSPPPTIANDFILGAGGNNVVDSGYAIIPISAGGTGVNNGFQEGTWTPGIAFGAASVGVTYATQTGAYLLITTSLGSFVFLTGTIILTNEGTSTGALTITGVPFSSSGLAGSYVPIMIHIEQFTASTGSPQGKLAAGTNVIEIWQTKTGSATAMNQTDTTNTSVIIFSTMYRVS
jgi:hypothetical protein